MPVVVTLQDYFFALPDLQAARRARPVCLRREIGADCAATAAADPRPAGLIFDATVRHDLASRARSLRGRAAVRPSASPARVGPPAPPRRRRSARADSSAGATLNVERLSRADLRHRDVDARRRDPRRSWASRPSGCARCS